MSRILLPPLADEIRELYDTATAEFVVISPWIKSDALAYLLGQRKGVSFRLRVLTVGDLRDYVSSSSDLASIETLLHEGADIRLITNLHAKVYVADQRRAIITSANLTSSGLEKNLEVGVYLDDDEVPGLAKKIEGWFDKGLKIDGDWLNSMRQSVSSYEKAAKDLKRIEESVYEEAKSLRGNWVPINIPKTSIRRPRGVVNPTTQRAEWEQGVENWMPNKVEPALVNEFLAFFHNAFEYMPVDVTRNAWFGIHKNRISITIGGLWMAAITTKRYRATLVVDKETRLGGAEFASVKATEKYTCLYWLDVPWDRLSQLNGSVKSWESYARACVSIFDSPISRQMNQDHKAIKINVHDLMKGS
jgi:hypothetical protein